MAVTSTKVSPLGEQLSRFVPVVLDVTSPYTLAAVLLHTKIGASYSLIYDGSNFTELFDSSSTVTTISGGYRFSLIPNGGWVSSPSIDVLGVETTPSPTGGPGTLEEIRYYRQVHDLTWR